MKIGDPEIAILGLKIGENLKSLESLSLTFSKSLVGPHGISDRGTELMIISLGRGLKSLKDLTLNIKR